MNTELSSKSCTMVPQINCYIQNVFIPRPTLSTTMRTASPTTRLETHTDKRNPVMVTRLWVSTP